MSLSIGGSGGYGGPRSMLRSFGSHEDEGRAFDRRIVFRLLAFVKPHWRKMVFAFVMMLVSTALGLATPYLIKVAIDQYIVQGDQTELLFDFIGDPLEETNLAEQESFESLLQRCRDLLKAHPTVE